MGNKKCAPCKPNSVGGQAVIEGVMMKNGTKVALAMRKADGSVEIKNSEFHPAKEKHKWLNIPILRGIVGFVESMILSFRTLGDSTDMLGLDELEEKEKAEKEAKKAKKKLEKEAKKKGVTVEELENERSINKESSLENESQVSGEKTEKTEDVVENTVDSDANNEKSSEENAPSEAVKEPSQTEENEKTNNAKKDKKKESSASTAIIMAISLVIGLALAVFLFMFLPTYATDGVEYLVTRFTKHNGINHYLQAAIEGVIKILIFIGYIASVSLMKDIRRTFEYHGAEHKSIACYEKGLELTPENAKKCSRFHPRCGTSFLFVMLLIGIVVGMFIPEFEGMSWLRSLIKLATLPVIMGVGYEFIMLAGKHDNWLTRALSAPGLWMQRITTKEPSDDQLAIAICAIKSTMPEEFPDFNPDEYKISIEENKRHIMYENKTED